MVKNILIYALTILPIGLYAQNFVPNGSFEHIITCPSQHGQIDSAVGWSNFTVGYNASPDLYNKCAPGTPGNFSIPVNGGGFQHAAEGDGYAGIFSHPNVREYIQCAITPLIVADTYEGSMSVSMANKYRYASDGLGVYFYEGSYQTINIHYTDPVPVNPQVSYVQYGAIADTANWVRLVDTFIAEAPYRHMAIGNYLSDSNMKYEEIYPSSPHAGAYYYIDSVVVRKLGTSVTGIRTTRPVSVDVFPNPVNDILHINNINIGTNIIIMSMTGKVVFSKISENTKAQISLFDLPPGMYVLCLSDKNGTTYSKIGKE